MYDRDDEKLNMLILSVAKGCGDCLDDIYALAGGRMFAVAVSIAGRDNAEDVLHDSLIKIARFAGRYRQGTNPYAWIMKVVRNTALDFIKRKNARAEINFDTLFNLSSCDYSPEKRETAVMLESAIKRLERDEQTAIYYIYYLDMTVREAAAAMKCGKSTVQRLVKRAEEKLKSLLRGTND